MSKILSKIVARRDSEFFRDPVQWQSLGLHDYIEIVKCPMDLGTVRKKLESRDYKKVEQCAADIRLVWSNAMLYNQPGSMVYKAAKNLSELFETQYSSFAAYDMNRPPALEEMLLWTELCHKIGSEDLGHVLQVLEKTCPRALIKKPENNDVVIEVDLIPVTTFRALQDHIRTCLPEICPTSHTLHRPLATSHSSSSSLTGLSASETQPHIKRKSEAGSMSNEYNAMKKKR